MMVAVFLMVGLLLIFNDHTVQADDLHFQPGEGDPEAFIQEAWVAFKTKYAKNYSNLEEEQSRKRVFFESLKTIEEHNYRYKMGLTTYNMGINEFSDMTFSEFEAMLGLTTIQLNYTNEEEAVSSMREDDGLTSMDWRKYGLVTPVKNQKSCGSCWAFSATGALEGQMRKKTGRLVSLSEQNLVDCSKQYGNQGCKGGWMTYAFKYIRDNGGIDSEASYPYEAGDGPCRYRPQYKAATVSNFVEIPKGSEVSLTHVLTKEGPVAVAINVRESFQHYRSGIYQDNLCDKTRLNHAVLAVGYDTSSDGQAYYIVKNSWGTVWGEQGYIRMARNRDNMCGIASAASFPVV